MLAIGRRSAPLSSLILLLVSACSGSHHPGPPAADDSEKIVVTPSISGTVTAASGGSQTLSIPFNASESGALANLTVTGLTELPAGWSGPSTFSCATVSTGNGCLLTLTFTPTTAVSGTLSFDYTYSNGSGVMQSGSLTIPYVSTTNNNVVGTASPSGQVVVTASSGSQAVAVTFDTDDGNPATALKLTTDLTTLPAGWSSTAATFTCASVSTGNGCQLPLSYAPQSFGSGTLTLGFEYLDDSGTSKTGTVSIPYSATTNDNVVATAAPSGQVNSLVAIGQSVVLTFTTDDGNPATNLAVTTSLSSLPAGWTSNSSSLSCATVSTGNGCQLTLAYDPVAVGSGTLQVAYSYQSNSGVAKTGTAAVPYAATEHDSVTGTVSPSGQINAVANAGTQSVLVTFDTNDQNVATSLTLTSSLTALPSGWSSTAHSFSCANVSTGNSCQLSLQYAPTAADSGTLTLTFGYVDNAGTAQTGTVSIPYAATTHDTVSGAVSPSGTLNVLLNTSQNVSVTFTTDDEQTATALSITSTVLGSLPSGWSSPGSGGFSCATVNTGSGCQLTLTVDPSAVASGTVSLPYSYTDNAGSPQTGTVSIPYVASVHNNVVGTASPSGTISTTVGTGQAVTVTFNTDDAYPATSLSVTSGLSALPAGWSSSSGSFSCTSVPSTGATCQLTLTYLPTAAATGTVTLNFSYDDDYGTEKSGTVSLAYSATIPHAYIADPNSSPYLCSINTDGTLSGCASMGLGFNLWDLAFNGNTVYMSNVSANNISICTVAADGTFSSCTTGGSNLNGPMQLSVQGSLLYVANSGGSPAVTVCSINTDGTLANCTATGPATTSDGIGMAGNYAYAGSQQGGSTIDVCAVDPSTGLLSSCTATAQSAAYSLTSANGYLYTSQATGVGVCPIAASNGGIPACTTSTIAAGISQIWGVTINGGTAYVTGETNGSGFPPMPVFNVYVCSVSATDGSLSNCVVSDGGAFQYFLLHVVIH